MSSSAQSYDLSTPAPLPRESARRLETQRDSLGEEMRIHVRRLLRNRTEVTVGAADVARVRHFAGFQDGKAWWYSGGAKADPGARTVLLGCAPDLVYAAIDRQLGGPGQAKATGKAPTAIEFELGMRFLRDLFNGLARALELPPLALSLVPARPLPEPLLTFMPDLEEPFARIPWKVKLFDQEHELLLCVSRRILEQAEPKPVERQSSAAEVEGPIASAPLELIVELARCRLTVEEAAALAPGDVVLFELPPGEPIDVHIQGKPRFRAKLGTHDGRYAIEVSEVLDPPAPKGAAAVATNGANAAAAAAPAAATLAAGDGTSGPVKPAAPVAPRPAAAQARAASAGAQPGAPGARPAAARPKPKSG